MYGYLPWYDYFITVIINVIINLNILDIDVFSPTGNQHQVNIYLFTLKNKRKREFYVMQVVYTNEFGKARNLNDIVREFP